MLPVIKKIKVRDFQYVGNICPPLHIGSVVQCMHHDGYKHIRGVFQELPEPNRACLVGVW